MPRDLDLRKLQAFGSEIVDVQAQPPDRVFVALSEGKIMVLDRLLVKHVLRSAQPILHLVSGATLPKQRLFLLPHESSLRYDIDFMNRHCTSSDLGSQHSLFHAMFQPLGRQPFATRRIDSS
jgi:hypothetical protein